MPEDKAPKWNISKDTLRFEIKMAKNPSARRELLLMLSIIYDLLGLKAPFLLEGRLIIQQLWRDRLGKDETVGEKSSYEWLKWENALEKWRISIYQDVKNQLTSARL